MRTRALRQSLENALSYFMARCFIADFVDAIAVRRKSGCHLRKFAHLGGGGGFCGVRAHTAYKTMAGLYYLPHSAGRKGKEV